MKPIKLNACAILAPYFRSAIQAPEGGWPQCQLMQPSSQLELLLEGRPPYHKIDPNDRGLLWSEVTELHNRLAQAESAAEEIAADLFMVRGELLTKDQQAFYSSPESQGVGSVVAACVDNQLERLRKMLAASKEQNEKLEDDWLKAQGRVDELELQVVKLMEQLEEAHLQRDATMSENDSLRRQLEPSTQTATASPADPWDDVTDTAWQGEVMKLIKRTDSKIKPREVKWGDTNSAGLSNGLVRKILDMMKEDITDDVLHGTIDELRETISRPRGNRRFSIVQHGENLANIVKCYCWLMKNPRTK